jgi:hypothetical protein
MTAASALHPAVTALYLSAEAVVLTAPVITLLDHGKSS